jgi:nitrous oxidase accessory protein
MEAKKITFLVIVSLVLAGYVSTSIVRVRAAELTVGGHGQYSSISAAVKAANSGDTIVVGPGTYVENVVIDKPLTLRSLDGAQATIIKASDASKEVVLLASPGITVDGFTVTGGNDGVAFGHVSDCVFTKSVVNGNVFGVYLSGATSNLVSNNNLNDNGFGIYLDGSSGNKLSNNSASNEKGGGGQASLSDGIYMFDSNANLVTQNDLTNNNNFGISLFNSKDNVISNNTMASNSQYGVRLREGADDNTFFYNTFQANAENGVLIGNATGNTFYFNNFFNEKSNFYSQEGNNVNSTTTQDYTYNGQSFSGFVGNYYSSYNGTDTNGDGIADTPFAGDNYPLMKPFENYVIGQPIPASTTASLTTSTTSSMLTNTAIPTTTQRGAAVPGFGAADVVIGVLIAAAVVTLKKAR